MRASAAVLYEVNKPLVVEDVEVLAPGPREVRVKYAANGVCHSDLHVMTGDYPHPLPVVLGHEASGVVEAVGDGVESVRPGDHVCSSYIPSCGRCAYCIGGQPTMCAHRDKPRWFMLDGTPRFSKNGQGLHHFLQVSGYATRAVLPDVSVIPIRKDAPLDVVCLVSCGVLAGAGPVFNRAKVQPGASVAVKATVKGKCLALLEEAGKGRLTVKVEVTSASGTETLTLSTKVTPGSPLPLSSAASRLGSMNGAPVSWKGRVVPRPSESAVASTRQPPG